MAGMKQLTLPKAKGLFITGTDTEVGKTLVTGAIASVLRQQGLRVGVFKPIASGCIKRREGLVSIDSEFLAHCAESPFSLEQITPVRYAEPLAPIVAAERSDRPIDWEAIAVSYRYIASHSDVVLVEGIGGVLVPLEETLSVLELMGAFQLPVVIVGRSGLGTLNHTLMSWQLCRDQGLSVAGIVLNQYPANNPTLAEETNPSVLAEWTGKAVTAIIPEDKASSVETGTIGENVIAAAGLADWRRLMSR